jgi:mRNA-degrading endonuclease YafQ of YafQ-DinJ toxin-antitoxin module
MKHKFFISILAILFAKFSNVSASFSDSLLVGAWKGTSICQVKPSPCHDEVNVYHITKADKPNIFHVVGNKIVDGKEENMGDFDFVFNPADNTLFFHSKEYKFTIKFTIKGDMMDGTLVKDDNVLYRIIKLKKE